MNQKVANRWIARIIPLVLVGIVGYATWVVIVLVCGKSCYALPTWNQAHPRVVDYLLKPAPTARKPRDGAAIAILTIYACLLLFLALTYLRLTHAVVTNPGYIPRGPQWYVENGKERRRNRSSPTKPGLPDLEKQNGSTSSSPHAHVPSAYGPANDVPAPGLEDFYNREVFTCESDGRPIWCSTCLNWKADRAHHCREVDRCVRKMDHFCPWYAGPQTPLATELLV